MIVSVSIPQLGSQCESSAESESFTVPPVNPFRLGWDAYVAGLAETDVPVESRRGWRAAWRTEGCAEYLAMFGDAGLERVLA